MAGGGEAGCKERDGGRRRGDGLGRRSGRGSSSIEERKGAARVALGPNQAVEVLCGEGLRPFGRRVVGRRHCGRW